MIRSRLATGAPRRLLVLAIAALVPVLAGCEAGSNAPTGQWHQPTAGAEADFHDISISNLFVLGPPIGQKLPTGSSAGLFLALANEGSRDKLVSISAPGTASSVTLPGGVVSLPSQRVVLLTGPAPEVILKGLTSPLAGGTTVRLVLNFQNASSLTIRVPVMPRAQYYSTFSPPPSPTPTATPKHSTPRPTVTPSPGATPTPTATPSPTP